MTMDRHDTIGAMLDEYALGQLATAERRDVERHALTCEVCTTDLRELTVVMASLAETVQPVVPPPALRARVLASLAAQSQEPGLATTNAAPQTGRATGVRPAWLAVAAVVIAGLGALLFSANSARRLLEGDLRQAEATAADLQRRLRDYAGQADLAVAILTAGDMQPIAMAGRENATASTARGYWSPTRGLLIVADDLPLPPPGRIYQVWVIGGGQPLSAGLLGTQGGTRGMLIAPPPPGVPAGTVTVAVTDEPPGGLAAPSGTIRLAGSL